MNYCDDDMSFGYAEVDAYHDRIAERVSAIWRSPTELAKAMSRVGLDFGAAAAETLRDYRNGDAFDPEVILSALVALMGTVVQCVAEADVEEEGV